ncbi:ABC transporter substrate-binding protein [Paenibacillus kyungheensis]|uniref:ABC transporter substrate-binding protein n=1 Tax=Paenibacillus kyungheensis TaxID=1452732 RepID=A0AAX3M5W8_9BACL|nr:ABC transporter substrate-binding protein [Paenibacillus kyungheensis]WCT57323.1 ABC transporter substrate-binding protein [Paenibacillus kyungheensis]
MKFNTTYAKAGLGLLLMLVFLTACGQPKETRADIFNPNGIKTMPINDSFGTVSIPVSPKRIAVTSQYALDYLNAIDVNVALAPKPTESNPFPIYMTDEEKNNISLIEGEGTDINLSALKGQKPDLIFTNNSDRAVYDELSKIAPTIYIAQMNDWRSELYNYGTIVDKETAVKQFLNAFQQATNASKSKLTPIIGTSTVAAASITKNGMTLYNNAKNGVGEVMYQDMALKAPATLPTDTVSAPATVAQLQSINPDYLFISTGVKNDTPEALNKRMTATADGATWNQLTAVQNGHVYIVDPSFFNNTPPAKTYVLETILKKVEGNS